MTNTIDVRQSTLCIVATLALLCSGSCSSSSERPSKCVPSLTDCGSECANLQLDVANCGECGHACVVGEACSIGECTRSCPAPLQTCGAGSSAICADTLSDPVNCGECGHICSAGETCTLGTCHVGCAGGGWTLCDEECVDTSWDANHCGACGVACAVDQACAEGACVSAATAPQPRLIMSFTADDTYSEQFTVMAPILEAHGMRGTMMVNVGRIDLPGNLYLTTEQLQALQALGHEIGSHGLTHQHLTAAQNLPDRIEREVCDSRVELLSRGFRVRTFAYPFGEVDGLAQSWVTKCGYTTGRLVGNLRASSSVWSETIPPKNPAELRAASSVYSVDTIEDAEKYVLDAEAHANGTTPAWLIMNFHRFCPNASCNPGLAWDTGLFSQFVDWIAARKPLGTVVRTISQVASGPILPPVSSETPLVLNGDLESYLQGPTAPPDCWIYGHSGDNTATWTQAPGRSGYGQQLVVTDFQDGSNSLLLSHGSTSSPDYKSCGMSIKPGRHYQLRCWFRSDVPVAFMLYKNDDYNDVVTPWMTTEASPASPSTWVQKSFGVTIPDGIVKYNTLFYGPYVTSLCSSGCLNGDNTATLLVDDCSAVDDTTGMDGDL